VTNGLRVPFLRFSCVNRADWIRSMEVRSENTPMGRVLLLTFRNLRLVAFVVRILGQKERSSILKKLRSSSSSSFTKRTAQGIAPSNAQRTYPEPFGPSLKPVPSPIQSFGLPHLPQVALTGSPKMGKSTWATFRVETPKTKQAEIIRSTCPTLRP